MPASFKRKSQVSGSHASSLRRCADKKAALLVCRAACIFLVMLQQAIFATAHRRFLYAIFTPFLRGDAQGNRNFYVLTSSENACPIKLYRHLCVCGELQKQARFRRYLISFQWFSFASAFQLLKLPHYSIAAADSQYHFQGFTDVFTERIHLEYCKPEKNRI